MSASGKWANGVTKLSFTNYSAVCIFILVFLDQRLYSEKSELNSVSTIIEQFVFSFGPFTSAGIF